MCARVNVCVCLWPAFLPSHSSSFLCAYLPLSLSVVWLRLANVLQNGGALKQVTKPLVKKQNKKVNASLFRCWKKVPRRQEERSSMYSLRQSNHLNSSLSCRMAWPSRKISNLLLQPDVKLALLARSQCTLLLQLLFFFIVVLTGSDGRVSDLTWFSVSLWFD